MKKFGFLITSAVLTLGLASCSGRTADGTSNGETVDVDIVDAEVVTYDTPSDTVNAAAPEQNQEEAAPAEAPAPVEKPAGDTNN